MSQNTLRMAHLLGEMRRQMNGAVVGGMRFYGAEYGLNYGVSLPTIRSLAKGERDSSGGCDHSYARLLYQQEVRELRLAALWIADVDRVVAELDFWAKGVINSEVAEEAAFALMCRCEASDVWLDGDDELLQYCALRAAARRGGVVLEKYRDRIIQLSASELHILPSAIVALLDFALKDGASQGDIEAFVAQLPASKTATFISDEMAWRMELL